MRAAICKIFETVKIDEESHADNQNHRINKYVMVLYTGMSLMLCAHSLYCDMSQLIGDFSIWECLRPE